MEGIRGEENSNGCKLPDTQSDNIAAKQDSENRNR
jgi:hypothetical protein